MKFITLAKASLSGDKPHIHPPLPLPPPPAPQLSRQIHSQSQPVFYFTQRFDSKKIKTVDVVVTRKGCAQVARLSGRCGKSFFFFFLLKGKLPRKGNFTPPLPPPPPPPTPASQKRPIKPTQLTAAHKLPLFSKIHAHVSHSSCSRLSSFYAPYYSCSEEDIYCCYYDYYYD